MKVVPFVVGFALLAGCSGGSTPESDATVYPTSRSIPAESLSTAQTNLAGESAADAVSEASEANALLTETEQYLDTTRATYTKTIGSVTATVTVTPTSRTSATFSIVLNGGPYTNYLFADGTTTTGTFNGKSGRQQQASFYNTASAVKATMLGYFYSDSSFDTTFTFPGTTPTRTVQVTATGTGAGTFTGKIGTITRSQVSVAQDRSGQATLYCTEDGAVRATATWSGTGSGQVCAFATACGGADRPCRSYPR